MTTVKKTSAAAAAITMLPIAAHGAALSQKTVDQTVTKVYTEINDEPPATAEDHTNGLIADLAWVLLLGAVVTLLFKKLKQPVVLGYILAGFLASPNFAYIPSISNLDNIHFWAEIGIVVLMFTLGLEFSFKKLMNSGSSAVVTALIIITGMTLAGFGVGRLLQLNAINSIFLGGMISMSSTTIILKSLTDLGMRQKKFATLVLSVLIIEDLFAVLMLVLLSSMAMGDVHGTDLLFSTLKLIFFLILWFVVGVYLLPTLLTKTRRYLNDETLLVLSMALCFAMAILSVMCGFSLELGAFVTGSILAGTMAAERIEHVVKPVKDLFGSVFFISVGMMVEPAIIVTYKWEVLILAAVVIAGMILFGTIGMLVTGQNLRVSLESGFTLTQIGEFSFIIASLGMSLGVLNPTLYPIIVAVSVITIFTTPYFIKLADPFYGWLLPKLPRSLEFLISRYSKQTSDQTETQKLWKDIISRYLWRIVLYSAVLTGIILMSKLWFMPLCEEWLGETGKLIGSAVTLAAMLPLLISLCITPTRPGAKMKLHSTASFYDVPLVVMQVIRYLIGFFFIVYWIGMNYSATAAWLWGIGVFVLILAFASTKIVSRYRGIEKKFMDNLNIREDTRSGRNNNLVDDLHQAYVRIGANCSMAGDRLRDSGLRRDYGLSVSSIQRGFTLIPLPGGDTRIFPGDELGIIGTDDQIKRFNDDLDAEESASLTRSTPQPETKLTSIKLAEGSPIAGKPLADTDIRHDYHSMIVKIYREDEGYIHPEPTTVLRTDDIVWVVGDPGKFRLMKGATEQ